MPSVFVSGTSGRIYVGGAGTPTAPGVAGLKSWSMQKNTKAVQLLHFESFVDTDGNFWEDQLPGSSSADVSADGWIDTNAATATDVGSPGIRNGLTVIISFILVRGTPWGFNKVPVFITQYEVTSGIDSDKPSTFKLTGKVRGSPGSSATITG